MNSRGLLRQFAGYTLAVSMLAGCGGAQVELPATPTSTMPAIPTPTSTTPATLTPTPTTLVTPTPAPTATLAVQVGQQAYTFQAEVTQGSSTRNVRFNYLLFLPKDYGTDPHKKWPLILFLHGAGETGNDLKMLEKHGIPRIVEQQADFPFITISPQCTYRGCWLNEADALNALLDEVSATYAVDTDRIYLTGLSMGGYGTWYLATKYPERFAAIVPIAGGGDPEKACALRCSRVGFSWRKGRCRPCQRIRGDGQRAESLRRRRSIYSLSRRISRLLDTDIRQPRTLRVAAQAHGNGIAREVSPSHKPPGSRFGINGNSSYNLSR